ncbi:GntR family transcriptional regulator [Salininema proteolyticum]|uniref:GntR family transcriptional regulator n=1 Tax=Salininema proteolyticum TaxID=1607685 RepID=A0ABV8TZJ6_9ACTN
MGSRRAEAIEEVTRRIVHLEYRPGQRIVERDLAEELGLSRIPLREALNRLEVDGLVTKVAGQGTIVGTWDGESVRDLFDLRGRLEPLAASRAAERRTDAQLERLRSACEHVGADAGDGGGPAGPASGAGVREDGGAETAGGRDVDQTDRNAVFHRLLMEAASSGLLEQSMRPMLVRLRWLFHLTSERGAHHQAEEHRSIYAAIRDGDAAAAERLTYEHVMDGYDETLAAVEGWSGDRVDPVAATRTRRRRG